MKSREMREEGSGRKRLQRESGGGKEAIAQDRAAEELRKSEARFRNLADTAPAMLWVTEPDGSASFISRGWYEFTGQTEEEGLGKGGFCWLDAIHPDDCERAGRMFQDANEKRRPFTLDYRLRRHDGEYRWAIDAGRPRFGPNSEFLGYIGSVLDITERKRAEVALRESEEKYRTVFTSIDEGFCVVEMLLDEQGKPHDYLFLEINPMFEQLTGLRNAIGRTARELVPGLEEFWVEIYGRVALTGEPVRFEHFAEPMNRWFNVHASRVGDETSRRVAIVFTNITERKRAEVLLAAEKKVLELIVTGAAMPEVLDTLMRETEAQSTDGMLCSVLLADEKGQRLLHGAASSLPPAYNEAIHGIVIGPSTGSCGTAAFERKPVFVTDIAADSRWADFKDLATTHGLGACHSTPILSSQGRLLGTIAMYYRRPHNPGAHDRQLIERAAQLAGIAIERSQAEEALRESEARYHSIFEKAVGGIFQTTLDGKYVAVNPALARMYGYDSPNDMIATITDIASQLYVDPGRRNEFLRVMQAQKEVTGFEALVYRKDGSFMWISESARTLRDQTGTVVGYEGTVEDITERKRAEGRLRATLDHVRTLSGRLATVQEEERARIARELHDELSVKLTCLKIDLSRVMSIIGNRVRADLRAKLNDRVRSMVGQVDSTIASLQRLVTQLRPALLDDLGLVAAIEWQGRDFQKRTGISCTCMTNADDIAIAPDRATAVFRICQEALTNTARHAQATAVTITVTSQPDSLQLVVADNGIGILDTKASDRQSLGLTGMQERAAQCGGTVTIEGDPDKGTTVTLCLSVGGGQPES